MRASIHGCWLFLAGLSSIACVNTDAAIFVDPSIHSPTALVGGGVLGTNLSGSFHLALHLGPRATGSSQVTLGAFAILDAAQKGAIVANLPVTSDAMFPVTVELNSDRDVAFTFDSGTKPLDKDVKAKLCDPAGIVIGGSIQDSLQTVATPAFSAVFHATGCM